MRPPAQHAGWLSNLPDTVVALVLATGPLLSGSNARVMVTCPPEAEGCRVGPGTPAGFIVRGASAQFVAPGHPTAGVARARALFDDLEYPLPAGMPATTVTQGGQ